MRTLLTILALASGASAAPLLWPLVARDGSLVERSSTTTTNAFLNTVVTTIGPINSTLDSISSTLGSGESAIASVTGYSTSENDLVSGKCGDINIIFARGTTEPGNVGILSGPTFFNAVKTRAGGKQVVVQGVDNYPANIPGYLAGGDMDGSKRMAELVQMSLDKCPKSAVVMSGYSQGGQVTHNAAEMLSAKDLRKVSSVVIFGDPKNGTAVNGIDASKTLIVCHDGDNICVNGDMILPAHLTYSMDSDTAADFVLKSAGITPSAVAASSGGGIGGLLSILGSLMGGSSGSGSSANSTASLGGGLTGLLGSLTGGAGAGGNAGMLGSLTGGGGSSATGTGTT